jgi:hypothetical protein
MLFLNANDSIKDYFAAYSLGNFVSNQRKTNTDGGVLARLELKKVNGITVIDQTNFILSWVYKKILKSGVSEYFILPAAEYKNKPEFFESISDWENMKLFIENSTNLLNSQNENVPEYKKN